MFRATRETNTQARQLFEKAIELDSQYAGAYARLSWSYWWLEWFSQWKPTPQTVERAAEMAQKATVLDDSLPVAHTTLGMIYLWKDKQYDQATAEMERAIALDPNYALGYDGLAFVLMCVGRPEEAIEAAKTALRLDPHNFLRLNTVGQAYVSAGQYEEAIAVLKKVLTYNLNFWPAHWGLAVSYSELGQEKEARIAGAEMLRLMPQFSVEEWKRMAPFKDPIVLERLAAALRKAGLK